MRIFLAIPRSPNAAFESDLWTRNLRDPLVQLGHEVVLYTAGVQPLFDLRDSDPDAPAIRERFQTAFLEAVEAADRRGRLDLVFSYFCDNHLTDEAIRHVRERTAPFVNFFCNNVHQFHLVQRSSRHYAACLVPEQEAMTSYRRAGASPIFFPMAANPDIYRPLPVTPRYAATFAGQRYGDRTRGILALREAGVDAHAFGQGWGGQTRESGGAPGSTGALRRMLRAAALAAKGRSVFEAAADAKAYDRLRADHAAALHPVVGDEAYVALFSESTISLGFLVLGDTHRTPWPLRQVRLREFEGPMAGAFYVTGPLPELALHYEIGKEIVCYSSTSDMVERCRYYLTHDEERERIRRAGHARARRDHTWTRRFEGLFAELKRRGLVRS